MTSAPPPPVPAPPPEDDPDLVAYLGLGRMGHARKLAEAGIGTRSALLALTADELRHTSGLGGAWAAAVLQVVTEHGDAMAAPKARGSPPGTRFATGPPAETAADRARQRLHAQRTP